MAAGNRNPLVRIRDGWRVVAQTGLVRRLRKLALGSDTLRDARPLELTLRLAALITILTALSLAHGVIVCHNAGRHFREGHVMTWASGVLLFLSGYYAQQVWLVRRPPGRFSFRHPPAIWRLLAVGFVFLAADEMLKIHEETDKLLHKLLGITEPPLTDHLDDVILVLYAVAGLCALVRYRTEFRAYVGNWGYLAAAAVLGGLSCGLDFISGEAEVLRTLFPRDPLQTFALRYFATLEEILKTYAGVCAVGAMARCWVAASRRPPPAGPLTARAAGTPWPGCVP
jgi:hypothetical protein